MLFDLFDGRFNELFEVGAFPAEVVGKRDVFGIVADEDEAAGQVFDEMGEQIADLAFAPAVMADEPVHEMVDPIEPPGEAEDSGENRLELPETRFAEGDLEPELPLDLADPLARDAELAADFVERHAAGVEHDDLQKAAVTHPDRTDQAFLPERRFDLGPKLRVERIGRREVQLERKIDFVVIQPGQTWHFSVSLKGNRLSIFAEHLPKGKSQKQQSQQTLTGISDK